MDPNLLPTRFLISANWDVTATIPKRITPLIDKICAELEAVVAVDPVSGVNIHAVELLFVLFDQGVPSRLCE